MIAFKRTHWGVGLRLLAQVVLVLAAATAIGLLGRAAEAASGEDARWQPGDAEAGREKSAFHVCQECHAADGNSLPPEYPKLAGQHATYLHKQLRDFQSGARKHQIMTAMADSVPDEDLADISAYFASRPVMRGEGGRVDAAARALYLEGVAERGIPACAGCHGADGRGADSLDAPAPVLAGQHRFYLRAQLLDWRNGVRTNSHGGAMSSAVRNLADAEIESLAAFLAGL